MDQNARTTTSARRPVALLGLFLGRSSEVGTSSPPWEAPSPWKQTRTAFATSIALDPGSYSGFAVLLDGAGQPCTTDVAITAFTLQSNEPLNVSVELPSDSFV